MALLERMKNVLNDNIASDFTICIDGTEFKTHSCILKTVPKFASLFESESQEKINRRLNVINKDQNGTELYTVESYRYFLHFIYTDTFPGYMTLAILSHLLELSREYCFDYLYAICIDNLKKFISVDNLETIMLLNQEYDLKLDKEIYQVFSNWMGSYSKEQVMVDKIITTPTEKLLYKYGNEMRNNYYNRR